MNREFAEWAASRQQALLRTAYLVTGDPHRAQDLVQDALTKVALRWSRLRSGDPEAYARRIVVRDNVSWWRRWRREVLAGPVPESAARVDGDEVERRLVLASALRRLTPKQRAVLVLRFYEDLTEAETAAQLGVSVGTVKSQCHAALARLRSAAPELVDLVEGQQ